jgi:hypothetical protein
MIARSRETKKKKEVAGAPRNVRTVEHEEALLDVFEGNGTWSVRMVARFIQEFGAENFSR